MALTIITNNVPRPIIRGDELTDFERGRLDYFEGISWEDRTFVNYRSSLTEITEFQIAPHSLAAEGWDGYQSDSHWSGLVIRYFDRDGNLIDGGDSVVMGRYFE